MRGRRFRLAFLLLASLVPVAGASSQTPQPFPKPGEPSRPQPAQPPAPTPPPGTRVLPPESQPPPSQPDAGEPDEQTLGMPVYPGAQFIASYDAGRGQRYVLFGTNIEFAQIVAYYRTTLKQRGTLVYQEPPIHMFDVGRYRDDAVAFPPGITVKDYAWGGSEGYLNPKIGADPARFRTIIQVVPPPPDAGGGR